MKNGSNLKIKNILTVAVSTALFVCIAVFLFLIIVSGRSEDRLTQYDWRTEAGEKIDFPFYGEKSSEDDFFTAQAVLEDNVGCRDCVWFYNRDDSVEITVGGEVRFANGIFSDGSEIEKNHFIKLYLEDGDGGKPIKVRVSANEEQYSVDVIYIGKGGDIVLHVVNHDAFFMMFDSAVILEGIMFIILSLFTLKKKKQFGTLFCFGQFLILFSLWLMTTRLVAYLVIDGETIGIVLLLGMAILPVPLCLSAGSKSEKKRKFIYGLLTGFGVVLEFVMMFTHFVLNKSIKGFVIVIHVYIIAAAVYMLIERIYSLSAKKGDLPAVLEFCGMCVFFALVLSCVVWGNLFTMRMTIDPSMAILIGVTIYALLSFISEFISRKRTLDESEKQLMKYEEVKTQTVLSQIKPHFVYNSLGAIRVMIKKDPDKAYDTLYNFTKYLRRNIDSLEDSSPVPFSVELDHIKTYVEIEKMRFSDKVNVEFITPVRNFSILPMTVQVFVENAIKHGIFPKEGGGTVIVKTFETSRHIYIEINDDGVGFDTKEALSDGERRSVGMSNAIYRIEKLMSGECDISSAPGDGTKVLIKIPKKNNEKNEENFEKFEINDNFTD